MLIQRLGLGRILDVRDAQRVGPRLFVDRNRDGLGRAAGLDGLAALAQVLGDGGRGRGQVLVLQRLDHVAALDHELVVGARDDLRAHGLDGRAAHALAHGGSVVRVLADGREQQRFEVRSEFGARVAAQHLLSRLRRATEDHERRDHEREELHTGDK